MSNVDSLSYFLPFTVLFLGMAAVLLADLAGGARAAKWLPRVAGVAFVLSGLAALRLFHAGERSLFMGMIATDPFAVFFQTFFALVGLVIVLFSLRSDEVNQGNVGEYYALLLATVFGMGLMASATDLLMIYLALEMVSVLSYIVTGFLPRNRRSSEAALKYVLYGAMASGIMIFGMSFLYGLTGSTNVHQIGRTLAQGGYEPITLFVAVVMILVGIGYKIAAVPFHFWSPDVYEGAPLPFTAFLSVGPKAAGFAMAVRFFYSALARPATEGLWVALDDVDWPLLLAGVSVATMTLGNFVALWQRNLKRLLAYSSIAHAGYLLLGLVALSAQGLEATMFYLVAYLFMNLGAFLVVLGVSRSVRTEDISGFAGLGWRSPLVGVTMTIFLIALTGLPLTAGFVGKFYLLAALVRADYTWLALIAVLNVVVSLYYYVHIVKVMYFDDPTDSAPIELPSLHPPLLVLLAAPTIVFGLFWAPLLRITRASLVFYTGP